MRWREWTYATIAVTALMPTLALAQVTETPGARTDAPPGEHLVERQQQGQFMADRLIGAAVHNLQDEEIGNVSELLLDRDGRVAAVVVGVGGFLGIGEHDVALRWDAIELTTDEEGEPRVRVDIDRDALERAPEIEYRDDTAAVWGAQRDREDAEYDRLVGEAALVPRQEEDQYFIEQLLGSSIRNAEGEEIGQVTEVLLDRDGRVTGLVVGVGGFLGIGEHDVALHWDAVDLTRDDDGAPIARVDVDREALERAPAFEYRDEDDPAGAWGQRREERERDAVVEREEPTTPAVGRFIERQQQDHFTAEQLIGRPVHGLEGEELGEVSDLLIGQDGQVAGVVIGVGGFLGIGRRDVGLSWDALEFTADPDDGQLAMQADIDRATLRAAPRLEQRD